MRVEILLRRLLRFAAQEHSKGDDDACRQHQELFGGNLCKVAQIAEAVAHHLRRGVLEVVQVRERQVDVVIVGVANNMGDRFGHDFRQLFYRPMDKEAEPITHHHHQHEKQQHRQPTPLLKTELVERKQCEEHRD